MISLNNFDGYDGNLHEPPEDDYRYEVDPDDLREQMMNYDD